MLADGSTYFRRIKSITKWNDKWEKILSMYKIMLHLTNSQSQSSNVSGFLHHEPDTSFKFVRRGNTGSYDF